MIKAAIKVIPWRETQVIQTRNMTGSKRLLWSFWLHNARSCKNFVLKSTFNILKTNLKRQKQRQNIYRKQVIGCFRSLETEREG